MQNIKLTAIFFLMGSLGLFSQKTTITLQSKTLQEERQILIGLPNSYAFDGPETKYPLVLITDGEWHFDLVNGATKLLYQNGFPKLIVAAIVNTERGRDLTMSHSQEIPSSGRAGQFLEFVTKELLPYLESEYRVAKHRTLMGHSLGGLFATYALSSEVEIFDGIVAVTPTIRWNDFELMDRFTNDFQIELEKKKPKVFVGIGNETGLEREGVLRLKSGFEESGYKDFSFIEYPTDSHVTVPWKAYFDGLKYVFESFLLPKEFNELEFSKTVAYYQGVGEYFDYDTRVPQRILFNRGYEAIGRKDFPEAIEVFEHFKKTYPNIPIPYTALGDIYFDLKQYKKSRENYERIYQLYPSEHIVRRMEQLKTILD
ncbi:alpha/beta hydrolase-fold protein [Flagellimonas flava]|uniref:Predicted hydrolase of the alpha/beta superfamily n=1 Tax=Flagellimonas flava TaxID=570519 RepID=A0A1M5K8T8_9FLAO|nr:alpha/beta hydrolase-fold protein [Allomuricauda flava]SHG49197.1 Predicted hydrolase of the alpha/beta superfamily [Allomuricauda flava]